MWSYYVAFNDEAGELKTCRINAPRRLMGEERINELSAAIFRHFGPFRRFIPVYETAEPLVAVLLEGGSVKATYSSQTDLRVEVFDLDLRSDGTPKLEREVRAGMPEHVVEVEMVQHYSKSHG